MTMNLVMPKFHYSIVEGPLLCIEVPAVMDPATLKIETYPLPRRFIYSRTTPEAILGMYEYELLGEQGATA